MNTIPAAPAIHAPINTAHTPLPQNTGDVRFRQLHLGCGPVMAHGFLNVDESFGQLTEQLTSGVAYQAGPAENDSWLLKHDLRQGLPCREDSLDVIYHSHLLEHLERDDGLAFLRQCFACLRPGALMRIALPDLALWARHYVEGTNEFFDWYRSTYLGADHPQYQTNAQVFMGMLYNHGHRMAYDFETLSRLLVTCGFVNIAQFDWGKSERIEQIAQLESHGPGIGSERRFESLVLECEKPHSG